jgi:hypothetical protein
MDISRRMGRWTARIAVALVAAGTLALCFAACNTPFIPIPPPADPTFTPVVTTDAMGGSKTVWQARGPAMKDMERARVYIYNADHGAGVIVRASDDGSYVGGPFEGKVGDRVHVQYEKPDGERSPELCRLLQEGLARTNCER